VAATTTAAATAASSAAVTTAATTTTAATATAATTAATATAAAVAGVSQSDRRCDRHSQKQRCDEKDEMLAHGDDLLEDGSAGIVRGSLPNGYGNGPPQSSQLFVGRVLQAPAAQGFSGMSRLLQCARHEQVRR
jgi:hypothetical protein